MSENQDKKQLRTYEDINIEGPSELEFTQAMNRLSETDRSIFEDTGVIHIDRDLPAQTQAMHVIRLNKVRTRKRSFVYHFMEVLLILGIVFTVIGLSLNRLMRSNNTAAPVVEEVLPSNAIDSSEAPVVIDNTIFPDAYFLSYISENFDLDKDGQLTAEERNAVLIMNVPEDQSITDLTGIGLFPLLQSLSFQNTGVVTCDLSGNTELVSIDASGSALQEINLSVHSALTKADFSDTALTSLVLPEESVLEKLDTEGTQLQCTVNQEGYFTSCQ